MSVSAGEQAGLKLCCGLLGLVMVFAGGNALAQSVPDTGKPRGIEEDSRLHEMTLPEGNGSMGFVVPPKRERLPDEKTVRISKIVVQKLIPKDAFTGECQAAPESDELCPVCEAVESGGFCAVKVSDQQLEQSLAETLAGYDNQLTIFDLEDVANSVTSYYRGREFILDTAFVPPQTIANETLVIHILQGRLGELAVKGNEWYQSDVLLAPFSELAGEPLSRTSITNALLNVWDYPGLSRAERKSRITFLPGKATGLTDLELEVFEEEKPYNVTLKLDNTGSEYTGVYRASVDVDFNNLTGAADRLSGSLMYNMDPDKGHFYSLRYQRPVISSDYRMAVGAARNNFELGKELADLDIEGISEQAYFSLERTFKRSFRERLSAFGRLAVKKAETISASPAVDRLTVLSLGTDYLFADNWKAPVKANQTLVSASFSHGFGDLLGAMDSKNDPGSSRIGSSGEKAGGQFNKLTLNLTRKQQLPGGSWLWLRFDAQYSPDLLVSLEQMALGGPNSVRAYPTAEYLRDSGYFVSAEWANYLSFLDDYKVPEWLTGGRDMSWGNALAFSVFLDHAGGWRNENLANEFRHVTLTGAGVGLRLQTPKATVNATLATPIDSEDPSNGNDPQLFISLEYNL